MFVCCVLCLVRPCVACGCRLLIGVRCLSRVVDGSLCVVCCSLCYGCCLWAITGSLLRIVCCVLCGVICVNRRLLLFVGGWLLRAVRWLLFAGCWLLLVAGCMMFAVCLLSIVCCAL